LTNLVINCINNINCKLSLLLNNINIINTNVAIYLLLNIFFAIIIKKFKNLASNKIEICCIINCWIASLNILVKQLNKITLILN